MSSGENCCGNVAGLIGGPVGNLVGVGFRALINGAPIGPRTSEAIKKPGEREQIKDFYDNVEAHLKGALQILQPALEIKQIISGGCKSAERDKPAINVQAAIQYYSPRNPKKCKPNHCSNRCCCSNKSGSRLSSEKSSFNAAACSKKEKSTVKNSSQFKSSSSNCKCSSKKDSPKNGCYGQTGQSIPSFDCKSEIKSLKTSTRGSKVKQRSQTCCVCDVSLKVNIVLAELPCQHLFCYTCLAIGKGKRCRKCDDTYDMKNVTQIFHKRSIRQ